MAKNRLESFSDGVLAIIITIMVLELRQPVGDSWNDLLALWPTLMAYAVSYLFVAIYWVNHHLIFQKTAKVNLKILWCNIAWLFAISFIPFTTAWVGNNPKSFVPICLYFSVLFFASVIFHLMYMLILSVKGESIRLGTRNIVSLIVYLLAASFGGFCPNIAFIIVAAVTFWWVFPGH